MLKKENVNGANIESPDTVVDNDDHHSNDSDNNYASDDNSNDDDEPNSHHGHSRKMSHGENANRSKQSSDVELPSSISAQLNIDMMGHDLGLDEDESDKAEEDSAKNLPKPKLIMLTLSW